MQNPLDEPLKRLEQAVELAKPDIIAKAGAIMLEFVNENFQKEGFQGETFHPWKPRDPDRNPGRKILKLRGHLENDTHITHSNIDEIGMGNSMPYAKIHNEGGVIHHPGGRQTLNFRKKRNGQYRFTKANGKYKVAKTMEIDHGFHYWDIPMPQRQFMGYSPVLNNRIEIMIVKTLISQFK